MQAHTIDTDNITFAFAAKFVTETSRSVFLTGKAGTGKTTFLKYIRGVTKKNTVVVAPTGVAAIQCGGATIHSFFQLPFSPFIPIHQYHADDSRDMFDRYQLLQNLKIDSEKRNLFRRLELLIIDEVSMVRCDVLDAIDVILRHFRRQPNMAFGGVQLLFIGDLYQLPPVMPDDHWTILRDYYDGPFFFQSHALRHEMPLYIELKKIYRQRDQRFIDILNRIRCNETEADDLEILNERYQPDFRPETGNRYITLTTHNHKADAMNSEELDRLNTRLHVFEGSVEGDFSDRNFPTEKTLKLKVGAQIMFLRNDMEWIRRYYNGKIGTISRIQGDSIFVQFSYEDAELEVEKETWENIRYTYNAQMRRVEEEVVGTFTQYAIRLAWAITIHKSQGLTFEQAIIDAGHAFAPGQVYVALSRCTSLPGVILKSKILYKSVKVDERVLQFAGEEVRPQQFDSVFAESKIAHVRDRIIPLFNLTFIQDELALFEALLHSKKFKQKETAEALVRTWLEDAEMLHVVGYKFQEQVRNLFEQGDLDKVRERVEAAVIYFNDAVDSRFIKPLQLHEQDLQTASRVKFYRAAVKQLCEFFTASTHTHFVKAMWLMQELEE